MQIIKYLFITIFLCFFISCSQSSNSINKAYVHAQNTGNAAEIVNILSDGDVNWDSLTKEEEAKLSACMGYILYAAMYYPEVKEQIDSTRYQKILDHYQIIENNQTEKEKEEIKKLTMELISLFF